MRLSRTQVLGAGGVGASVTPRNVAPGGTATLSLSMMPRPATCSIDLVYPGGVPGETLAAQTAVLIEGFGYGMSWTFVVPANTPAGAAAAWSNCTYPGASLPYDDIGFNIVP